MATKVLNIDDLKSEVLYVIEVDGEEHKLVAPTVQDFLDNIADLEALAAAPNIKEEINVSVRMIVRAIPTLTEERVKSWPLTAIERLFNVVRGYDQNGEVVEKDEEGNVAAAN